MKCPKCGFEQPDDIFCANCGVDVEAYGKRSEKNKKTGMLAILTGVIITIAAIIFIVSFFGGKDNAPLDEPLIVDNSMEEPDIDNKPSPRRKPKPEKKRSPTRNDRKPAAKPVPVEAAKPIPPTVMKASLENASGLVEIPVGSIDGERGEIRVASVKDGTPRDVVFQVDDGWDFKADRKLAESDLILVRAADAGDMDNGAAAPTSSEDAWIVEVKDPDGRKGWFYIYHSYNQSSSASDDYVKFSMDPEGVSSENYSVTFDSRNRFAFSELVAGNLSLLDKMKIRVSNQDFIVDETAMFMEPEASIDGPLMAAVRLMGDFVVSDNEVEAKREIKYYPDRFNVRYTFDFPGGVMSDGVLRVYLDFAPAVSGMKIITSDMPQGETIDGEGVAGEHRSNWFVVSGAEKTLRATLKKGAGKLIIMDDTSVEDPPENDPGCMGCAGFEFADPRGNVEFELQFEFLDWRNEESSKKHPEPPSYNASVSEFK